MNLDIKTIVHYSRGEPFRSITSLPSTARQDVLQRSGGDQIWGRARFDDPNYIPRRLRVEARMRSMWSRLGGSSRLEHPIYFTVGRHPAWETQRKPGMFAHVIAVADLDLAYLSFTTDDSLLALCPEYRREVQDRGRQLAPHADRLFRLDELCALDRPGPQERFEAQLWDVPTASIVQTIAIKPTLRGIG